MAGVWDLVKLGRFEEASRIADVEWTSTGSLLSLRNKVCALLHLEGYEEAISLADQIISESQFSSESDFLLKGIALWCCDHRERAIQTWHDALNCRYSDAASGVTVQVLLLYGAIRTRNAELRESSVTKLATFESMRIWPSPLAALLAGKISRHEIFTMTKQPILRQRQVCQANFAIGIKSMIAADFLSARASMTTCLKRGPSSSLEKQYFLAKWELKHAPPPPH